MDKIEVKVDSLGRLLEECLIKDARCRAELAAVAKFGVKTGATWSVLALSWPKLWQKPASSASRAIKTFWMLSPTIQMRSLMLWTNSLE
jgi:hypothetical protein